MGKQYIPQLFRNNPHVYNIYQEILQATKNCSGLIFGTDSVVLLGGGVQFLIFRILDLIYEILEWI